MNRLPVAKAKTMAADVKNPQRFRDRKNPAGVSALGKPTDFLKNIDKAKEAWEGFKTEWPWLNESDRPLMEVLCVYRAQMLRGEMLNSTVAKTYQSMLSKCGGSPSDLSKVFIPSDDEGEDDIFDA